MTHTTEASTDPRDIDAACGPRPRGRHVNTSSDYMDWCDCTPGVETVWDADLCTSCGRIWGNNARVGSPVLDEIQTVSEEWGTPPISPHIGRHAA